MGVPSPVDDRQCWVDHRPGAKSGSLESPVRAPPQYGAAAMATSLRYDARTEYSPRSQYPIWPHPVGYLFFLRLALASPADTWSLCSLQSRCLRLRRDPAKAAAASIRLVYSRVYSCIWPKCTFDPPVWTGGRPLSDGLSEVARCVVTISCTK